MDLKDKTILSWTVFNPVPTLVTPVELKRVSGKQNPLYVLIMDNMETSLVYTVIRSFGNASGFIV